MQTNASDYQMWLSLIRKVDFFSTFNDYELEFVLKMGDVRKYAMHEYVIKESETNTALYIILKGRVDVIKRDVYFKKKTLSVLEIGDCFGEMAFLLGQKRQADIMSVSEAYIYKARVMEIERMDPDFRATFYKQLSVSLAKKLRDFNKAALTYAI